MRTEAEPSQRPKEGFFKRHKDAALYGALYVAPAALFWLASEGAESMLEMDGVDVALSVGLAELGFGSIPGAAVALGGSGTAEQKLHVLKGYGGMLAGVASGIVLAGATDII